jgi:hypothetical protein
MEEKEFRKHLKELAKDAERYEEVRTNVIKLITEIENTKGSIKKKDLIHKLYECILPKEPF